jgi:hypothetical protein
MLSSFIFGQEPTGYRGIIKVKKQDTATVYLTLAKITEGTITKEYLLNDPILRIERNFKNKYTLKSYIIAIGVNGIFYDYKMNGTNKLNQKQLDNIRDAEDQFQSKLWVERIIVVDTSGIEIKLPAILIEFL